eukprot:TRINITY_DN12470_c0_g1_i1.p1 TRINITY_DN12470_c0_g1~~TRINITY_DN12470_c0_g1_i1.p1  ORF type:complete len:155 (+),score=16.80 TRINITY_DN12470_c0_g1_i1:449-913(+)
MIDYNIFLNISKECCWKRRQSTTSVSSEYFMETLWPSYQLYNSNVKDKRNITIFNGEQDPDTLYPEILKYINEGYHDDTNERENFVRNISDEPDMSIYIQYWEKYRSIYPHIPDNENHKLIFELNQEAELYASQGLFDKAVEIFKKVVRITEGQ